MINSQEEDEFVAVRVQDPRIQNEGSWNSYVDFKIFLHTNSKAFTAKTSCVRRRYSEFAWLKKKLQKNAGLVPVPELPGKSFLYFSNEDFLEARRKGLQTFLDKVVHMTVCLSDSQLHLFLQTQLPVGHIQDCVQGHTPYTVMDAILTYASSNRGFAQAQEEDSVKEPSLTVSYESMESPAPHQPCLQTKESGDPLEGALQRGDQAEDKSSLRLLQKNNHLEAVVEAGGASEATFYLGDGRDDSENADSAERSQQTSCQIQTPVEVHSSVRDAAWEGACPVREDSSPTADTEKRTTAPPDAEEEVDVEEEEEEDGGPEEVNTVNHSETEEPVNSVVVLDFKDGNVGPQEEVQVEVQEDVQEDFLEDVQVEVQEDTQEKVNVDILQVLEDHQVDVQEDVQEDDLEEVLEDVCTEKQLSENHVVSEVDGLEKFSNSDGEKAAKEETPLESEIQEETHQPTDHKQAEQEVDLNESDEDSRSLPSSNESIVKVSDEDSACDEAEDAIQAADDCVKTSCDDVALWRRVEASSRNILDLHMNGSAQEEDLSYPADFSKSLELNSAGTGGDLTESGDFSVLETSCSPASADRKQEALSLLSLEAAEEPQGEEPRYLNS